MSCRRRFFPISISKQFFSLSLIYNAWHFLFHISLKKIVSPLNANQNLQAMVIAPFRSLGRKWCAFDGHKTRIWQGLNEISLPHSLPHSTQKCLAFMKNGKVCYLLFLNVYPMCNTLPLSGTTAKEWSYELIGQYRYDNHLSECPKMVFRHICGETTKNGARFTDSGATLSGLDSQIYPLLSMWSWVTY